MNHPFWTTLAYTRDRKDTLSAWQHFFREQFDAIRAYLLPCPGEYATSYLHPERGMLCLRRFENRWAAYSDPEFGVDDEDTELTEADVLLYRLDLPALRERLRAALGIDGPSSPVGPELDCLGTCTQGPKRRRVFWVQSRDDAAAIVRGQEVIARSGGEGCVVVTSLGEATDRMLAAAGVSGVGLEERLTLTPGSVEGGCGIVCRHLQTRADAVERLAHRIEAGFEKVRSDRIADAVQHRDQRETIGEMAEGPDRFLSGLQVRLSKAERELFLELVARTETPEGTRFYGYAEIGERLGVTKQAVHKRLKALEASHPQVADYIRVIRDPAKPRNFSEMSPSDRRREGVEDSYGYDADG